VGPKRAGVRAESREFRKPVFDGPARSTGQGVAPRRKGGSEYRSGFACGILLATAEALTDSAPSWIAALHNIVLRLVEGKDTGQLFGIPRLRRAPGSVPALPRDAQSETQGHRPRILNGAPQCLGYGLDSDPAGGTAPQIVDVGLGPALVLDGHRGVPTRAPSVGTRVANSHLHLSPSPEDVGIPARPGSTLIEHGSAGA